MSAAIHLKRKAILILCIPLILLLVTLVFHEQFYKTPSGQRRILQVELQERMKLLDNATLSHLPIFYKGNPRRIVIFAHEHSGYELMEEVLLTVPGVFIHKPVPCEPGTDAGDDRDWSVLSSEFRDLIINETLTKKVYPLLHCSSSEHQTLVGSSSILSSDVQDYCNENPITCSSEYFQRQLCEMSSLQVLVLKNFDLHMALHLKHHKDLHLVYMIRDPRAVSIEQTELHSGKCSNFTHCYDVSDLCRAMRNNEEAVEELVQMKHKRFKLLRLEEFAFNMMPEMWLMFESWGIEHTGETYNVMNALKEKINKMSFEWDKEKPFAEVGDIQDKCRKELEFYAFKLIENQEELDLKVRSVNDMLSRLKEIEAQRNQ